MKHLNRGWTRWEPGDKEQGFTLVELILGVVLFSIIAYASMSLMSSTFGITGRMFAEFDSRKRVMVLLRIMAEGTAAGGGYAGYLGASNILFHEDTVEFDDGPDQACVFRIEFPRFETETTDTVEYAWRPSTEAIYQRIGAAGNWNAVLTGVSSFSVRKLSIDKYTIRVDIGHRVKGFAQPIVRGAEGQARNMVVQKEADWAQFWSERIKECEP